MISSDPKESAARLPLPTVREPQTLTIFGATGDLTHRKLMPALFAMQASGLLEADLAIVGFARRDYDDNSFRAWMAESVRAFSRVPVAEDALDAFCRRLHYHRGDLTDPEAYRAYAERLARDTGFPANQLYYLSVAPTLFEPVIDRLHQAGLVRPPEESPWSRVVIEKPFGSDLASAMALNRRLRRLLRESQVYRIDHYLGKETVQNILSFRLANAIFEPLFNNRYVDHVEITASETVGMEKGRGAYFDATGCLRDMVQNHMLQLLCLVAMEPPANLTPDAVRNEKVKVLQSIVPLGRDQVLRAAIRAQYVAGTADGAPVPGYLEEERVDPASRTETYAALRLELGNWRWAGVPFYLRTGKRLHRRATEIRVQFKMPPLELFQTVACDGDVCDLTHARPNVLVFRIQPDEGISLRFSAKRPALQMQVESVAMDFTYAETWKTALPEAYERLLLDVMRGDSTLFTRADEVEAAWRLLEPVLTAWAADPAIPMYHYRAGTWGPPEADALLPDENAWTRL
jgi:glucose-6-phosphate 1-dehydrogenase